MPFPSASTACSGYLPSLKRLDLQSAHLCGSRGALLLRRLVAGAGGGLRELRLGRSNVAELDFLEGASRLTRLDLAGAEHAHLQYQSHLHDQPHQQDQPPLQEYLHRSAPSVPRMFCMLCLLGTAAPLARCQGNAVTCS